ncbi:MAG: 4Fe-4S dicluster domain-containing protein [bacterium]
MFRSLLSEIREALICLKAGRVTLPYPFKPHPPKEGFRGKPEIDLDKCNGCGGCVNGCPARLIAINDIQDKRIIEFDLSRCTYCGRCQETCPEEAIKLSQEFELATDKKEDLIITIKLNLVKCDECGQYFTTKRVIDKLIAEVIDKIKLEPSTLEYMKLCPNCRRKYESSKMYPVRDFK